MGLEIVSFTIKDVFDKVDYLSSLGKAQTAVVKRDADIGVAEANRDAGIRVSSSENSWISLLTNDSGINWKFMEKWKLCKTRLTV